MSPSTSESFTTVAAAKPEKQRRKRPSPFPIRLSAEERAYLERKAGNRPLGTYIRATLLDGEGVRRRKGTRAPSLDHALLGKVLGMLGESELAWHLCVLAVAVEAGRLTLEQEDCAALRNACASVQEMRALLVKALGLRSGAS